MLLSTAGRAQHDVSTVIANLLHATRVLANTAVECLLDFQDDSEWCALALPADDVTASFLAAYPEFTGLVCGTWLLDCDDKVLSRGSMLPFVFKTVATNGLATALAITCGNACAVAVKRGVCTAGQAADFAVENSKPWHLFRVCRLLDAWPGRTAESYACAKAISAHATLSGVEDLDGAALRLARACFVFTCYDHVHTPSEALRSMIFAACVPDIPMPDQTSAAPDGGVSHTALEDVQAVFPRLIDVETRKLVSAQRTAKMVPRKEKCVALCTLLQASDGLSFE